jgi:hypothetical protein
VIENKNTNIVYLSDLLQIDERFEKTCNRLKQILEKRNIKYKFLKSTKDIWCRDYMPIQVENDKFIQFRYEPSYLKDELNLQSDPRTVCQTNNFEPKFSNITLDGANAVFRCGYIESWGGGTIKIIEKCKEFATKYIGIMGKQFRRVGVWMDFDNPYLTYKNEFIESYIKNNNRINVCRFRYSKIIPYRTI